MSEIFFTNIRVKYRDGQLRIKINSAESESVNQDIAWHADKSLKYAIPTEDQLIIHYNDEVKCVKLSDFLLENGYEKEHKKILLHFAQ